MKLDSLVAALPVDELPTRWYNIQADMPEPVPPPRDPPSGPSRIKALPEMLVAECLRQETSTERWVVGCLETVLKDLRSRFPAPSPSLEAIACAIPHVGATEVTPPRCPEDVHRSVDCQRAPLQQRA